MTKNFVDNKYALDVLASGEPGYISLGDAKKVLEKALVDLDVNSKAFEVAIFQLLSDRNYEEKMRIKEEILENAKKFLGVANE